MLALKLNPNEYIQIGDNIKVYSNETFSIKLAIDAPRDIAIVRSDAKHTTPSAK